MHPSRRGPLHRANAWRVLVAAAIVWLMALGTVGMDPASGAQEAPGKPRLLVIGDSIILGTHDNIAANLPGWDVTFDADVSRSTAAGLDVLRGHGTDFSAVVIALGANDGGTPAVFSPRVGALLDALDGVPHVIWLTIHQARPYYAQANAIIRDQVAHHPNATVGDWNAAIRPGDVGGDGLHLTGQGSQNMAVWVAELVRSGAAPPTTTTVPPTTSTSTSTTTTTSSTTTTTLPATTPAAATATTSPSTHPGGPVEPGPKSGSSPWAIALGVAALLMVGGFVAAKMRRTDSP